MLAYARDTVEVYGPIWHEALMAATYQVLIEVLQCQTVYMHSWETGCELKNCAPPRSLYSRLPKRFCMQPVYGGPRLVTEQPTARRALRRIETPVWFRSHIGRRYQENRVLDEVRHEAA